MLPVIAYLHAAVVASAHRSVRRVEGDAGQTTAEYALVLLGGAAIAMLLVTWATKSDVIGKLFDFVLGKIMGGAK
jgi:hypothetical protein